MPEVMGADRYFWHMVRVAARVQVEGMRLLAIVLCVACSHPHAATPSAGPATSHDFDFNLGVWHTQIQRIHAGETTEMAGTVTVRPVWDGRAELEEIEVDGPKGHWRGMTLFTFNPAAQQWNQTFVGGGGGTDAYANPLVGSFANGRGELYAADTVDGKAVIVRGVWSEITPDAHRYDESYSSDGGATWSPAFRAKLTREAKTAPAPVATDHDGSHDFDFDLGTWQTKSTRLLHPLTGSKDWVDYDGETIVRPVWGGRANLAEYHADGKAGHLELLALRVYDPAHQQWSINFTHPESGTFSIPGVGVFANHRVDFYDQEPIGGRAVLVRFSMWPIDADHAQSEQAFSNDGGKTWEVNWINRYARTSSGRGADTSVR